MPDESKLKPFLPSLPFHWIRVYAISSSPSLTISTYPRMRTTMYDKPSYVTKSYYYYGMLEGISFITTRLYTKRKRKNENKEDDENNREQCLTMVSFVIIPLLPR